MCLAAALAEQGPDGKHDARLLFEHACKHGLAVGCTNWAASVWTSPHDERWQCLYRVFEKTCEPQDPFGCGMTGRLLIEDGSSPIDIATGLVFVQQACVSYAGTCRMLARYIEQGRLGPVDHALIAGLM
jgi:hypothetical protein